MALSISEINAVSKKYFDSMMEQQVYEDSPFFKKLNSDKRKSTSGGTSIQYPVRIKKLDNARRTGFRSKVEFQSNETRTGADLEWVKYDSHTMIHHDEKIKNYGKGEIISLAKDRAEELIQDLKDKLYEALYATSRTAGSDLESLLVIVDSADTYAGIAVSDASEWAAQEDSSTTTLKLYGSGSLSYMLNAATFGTRGPNMHVTTRDLVSKYESLLSPQQRYEDKEMANLGFDSVTFHGKPIVGDAHVPAGYWLGLDMKAFELRTHADSNMKPTEWFDLKQAGFPDAMAKYVAFVGNLMCRMRKTNFKFSALDYTL